MIYREIERKGRWNAKREIVSNVKVFRKMRKQIFKTNHQHLNSNIDIIRILLININNTPYFVN